MEPETKLGKKKKAGLITEIILGMCLKWGVAFENVIFFNILSHWYLIQIAYLSGGGGKMLTS